MSVQLYEINTDEELSQLPDESVVISEIEEYHGTYTLIKGGCCSGWHTFQIFDGEIEIVDDYTPCLPAILVMTGVGVDE